MRLTVKKSVREWVEESGRKPFNNWEVSWEVFFEVWDEDPWPVGKSGERLVPSLVVRYVYSSKEVLRIGDEEGARDVFVFEVPSEGPARCSECGRRYWKEWEKFGWHFNVPLSVDYSANLPVLGRSVVYLF